MQRDSNGKERKETEEVKFEAPPTRSTEERLQTNGREMFLGITGIMQSITNEQQKAEFFFSNVDELRKIIAEFEKVGCNGATHKKCVDAMESWMLFLREKQEAEEKLAHVDKRLAEAGLKLAEEEELLAETEEELAHVGKRLAEAGLELAEEEELLAELNNALAEARLSRFFRYVLLFVCCVVGCVLVEYLRQII
ncbi:hypothetical protein AQUCO_04500034v1 [Aquilegia coerulea]|uniref:Uncharacterized protein n=1 Tax=Aquilegia coerulea TaxID=218851 RepID=A0A2G5CMT2_AQUCA|nr:hypothetical protein AQUCO_04500034v1 [Aquilegia coerulea]